MAKKHGVSAHTIYSWRKHFGSLELSDVKHLRQLEQENGRLNEDGGGPYRFRFKGRRGAYQEQMLNKSRRRVVRALEELASVTGDVESFEGRLRSVMGPED